MPDFDIELSALRAVTARVRVHADDLGHARAVALDDAGDYDWTSSELFEVEMQWIEEVKP